MPRSVPRQPVPCMRFRFGRQELDLSQSDEIQQLISEIKPNVIVNAAAYTAVDKAESEPDLAMAINASAPKEMAIAAQDIGATLLHISTDYVFNGKNHTPLELTLDKLSY